MMESNIDDPSSETLLTSWKGQSGLAIHRDIAARLKEMCRLFGTLPEDHAMHEQFESVIFFHLSSVYTAIAGSESPPKLDPSATFLLKCVLRKDYEGIFPGIDLMSAFFRGAKGMPVTGATTTQGPTDNSYYDVD
jgi:hypothetical protein